MKRAGCVAAALAFAGMAGSASADTFTYTGSEQMYAVPSGVTLVRITAVGAAGGGVSGCAVSPSGGRGDVVTADVPVTAGRTLFVEVGGVGMAGGCGLASTTSVGGFNGGAAAGVSGAHDPAGGGGGASDVRTVSAGAPDQQTFPSRLVVAGGGGGAAVAVGPAAGGDAGQAGWAVTGAGGGGGGVTGFSGGSGGVGGTGSCTGGSAGLDGAFVGGGRGGPSATASGGGGGGGYYGGGGGSGDNSAGGCGGGGGGGGSNFVVTSATNVSQTLASASTAPSVTITPIAPPHVSLGGSVQPFGITPQGTIGASKQLMITNTGGAPLHVGDLGMSGDDPGDFLVTGCRSAVAPARTCTLEVLFAPQAQGVRSATLEIGSDDPSGPSTVALSGTGGPLPTGPTGATGPAGPVGPKGDPGQIELVTCKTVTVKVRGRKRNHRRCTTKLVSGPVKFKTATKAALMRRGVVYARGTTRLLRGVRAVPAGRYTLRVAGRRSLIVRVR
jgi:hypothetical protein